MEENNKPYIYDYDNQSTRMETREETWWYYQQGFTGAEAFRACQLALIRWNKLQNTSEKYTYLQYLYEAIDSGFDMAPVLEFSRALEEVMDERNAISKRSGEKVSLLPVSPELVAVDWQDCNCCDKCIWGKSRKEIKPFIK